jgi:hypothetical protein
MTKEIGMAKDENVGGYIFGVRASSLIRHSSFERRHFDYAPRIRETSGRLRSLFKISWGGASLI